MKKNKKGFALIEVLTVTVVVLVIFTMLYSNLFPLIGEYEKRVLYNDVETQYISFYMRKLYKDINITLDNKGYKVLYDGQCHELTGDSKTKCENIADVSDVVSMIVTTKSLSDLKDKVGNEELKELSDYIHYLPEYNKKDKMEAYRLIIKTKMGYATTELKVENSNSNEIDINILIKKVGRGGLVAEEHSATEQLVATTDYRYIGKNPDNYIKFNNEIWRIIGVFEVDDGTGKLEKRIKIIRESIGNLAWNSIKVNDWSKASLMTLLNSGDYYNRLGSYASNGLTSEAKTQIADVKWYLGGITSYRGSSNDLYNFERGTTVYSSNPTYWVGKVGLMYPSDYMYATEGGTTQNRAQCLESSNWEDAYDCKNNDWLFDSSSQWTLTHGYPVISMTDYYDVIGVDQFGTVMKTENLDKLSSVHPSVYLKAEIKLTGEGTSEVPYEIVLY